MIRDEALEDLPPRVAELVLGLMESQAHLTRQFARLNAAVNAVAPVTKVCPGCMKPVWANPDGTLPVHEINGLVVGRQRRTTAVCRYQPEAVA